MHNCARLHLIGQISDGAGFSSEDSVSISAAYIWKEPLFMAPVSLCVFDEHILVWGLLSLGSLERSK